MRRTLRPILVPGLLAVATLVLNIVGVQASSREAVTVYYNRACADCLEYVGETVMPLLRQRGYTNPAFKDYLNELANRAELLKRSETLGVPSSLQSHLTVFIGDRLVLEGHIQEGVVAELAGQCITSVWPSSRRDGGYGWPPSWAWCWSVPSF